MSHRAGARRKCCEPPLLFFPRTARQGRGGSVAMTFVQWKIEFYHRQFLLFP